MPPPAAEPGRKRQLASMDGIDKRTKHWPLCNPCKVAKLKHPASCSVQKKKEILGEDRITQLPEEILVAILSLLPLQEAGRTSVLSHKWRYLWTFITRRLNFDAWKSVLDVRPGVSINSSTYASWVNQVLKLHQGPFVDEFIIHFSLEPGYSHHVDSWINFAFEKGVKRLELDLVNEGYDAVRPRYSFPSVEKLRLSSNAVGVQSHGHVSRAVGYAGFSSLITLRLRFVNVTDEVIEHFLGNCPLLEELHVISSRRLRNLKVGGVSLKLKLLEISDCFCLRVLEVSAINLVTLIYDGPRIRMLLTNVPLLSEFCIDGEYCESLVYKDRLHSSYLQQLDRLKMTLDNKVLKASRRFPRELPELCRLKQLELHIWGKFGDSLIIYTTLIKACPSLSKFTMRYTRERLSNSKELSLSSSSPLEELYEVREAQAWASKKYQHHCLKIVELFGFIGHAKDLELAWLLLEIAVSLDKLVINPRGPYAVDNPGLSMNVEELERRRVCARLLETKLPPGASLVVL